MRRHNSNYVKRRIAPLEERLLVDAVKAGYDIPLKGDRVIMVTPDLTKEGKKEISKDPSKSLIYSEYVLNDGIAGRIINIYKPDNGEERETISSLCYWVEFRGMSPRKIPFRNLVRTEQRKSNRSYEKMLRAKYCRKD